MLSLGHASEMLPSRLSLVKAEKARHINNAAAVLADQNPPHCHLHPMSTIKPRAPLPWERELDDARSPQYAPRRCKVIRSIGGPVVAYDVGIPEADYIVHAANAYPKLIKLLHAIDAGMRPETAALAARNTLLDLGELPPE